MTSPRNEYGRAARLFAARAYFGVEQKDMADLLNVRLSTYQRWENGRDSIPPGIWKEIDTMYKKFDDEVAGMVTAAQASDDARHVEVWRGRNDHHAHPGWLLRVVSEAMRREPSIEPVYHGSGDD